MAEQSTGNTNTSTNTNQSTNQTSQNTQGAQSTWTSALSDDLRGFVQTKGFAEPKDVVESYRNLEKLHGVPKERLLALPEKMDGPEASAVWERLGKPKEAKEYKIEIPKEYADEKFSSFIQETALKLNMPRSMAEGFAQAFNERQKAAIEESQNNIQMKVTEEKNSLQKEWGSAYEQNKGIVDQTIRKLGLSADEVKAFGGSLGIAKTMKMLHKLGEGLGEATYIDGGSGGGSGMKLLSPDSARVAIKELMKDTDFTRRLSNKEVDAVKKWDNLHKQAYPGSTTA